MKNTLARIAQMKIRAIIGMHNIAVFYVSIWAAVIAMNAIRWIYERRNDEFTMFRLYYLLMCMGKVRQTR